MADRNIPPILNICDYAIPSPYVMSWEDVKALLKAGLNPRFCADKKTAVELLTGGGRVDCLSFMGGFSHVVYMAGYSKDGAIQKKTKIDLNIELAVDKYVDQCTRENWEALSAAVDKGTTATANGQPFTEQQRAEIAKLVQRELIRFFEPPSRGQFDLWLAFVKALDMTSSDADAYGGFGKSGSKNLNPDHFVQNPMYSVGQIVWADVANMLAWGFVRFAREYGATLGW